jgi:hypothetical protein
MSISINSKPRKVFNAFTNPNELNTWLRAHGTVVALCKDGPFAIGWCANEDGDYYACSGKIKNYKLNKQIFINNIDYYFANKKTIAGLNLDIHFEAVKQTTVVTLKQSGNGSGKKWEQNFCAVFNSWEEALYLLKKYIEKNK